ncbi:MAG: hypothetical protein CMB64_06860 [Euryarchaeota archaeon]|nr:hypothetical protein [Euryarchaeota archaeon]
MNNSEEIKKNIARFLELCVDYADRSLERKKTRLQSLGLKDKESAKQEIEKWENYKQFTEYTIKELSSGDLDEWILNLDNEEFNPEPRS